MLYVIVIVLCIVAYAYLRRISLLKKEKLIYQAFLDSNNESTFFVYTSKQKTQDYIEKEILPNLKDDIKVVFLEGKVLHTDLDIHMVQQMVIKQKVVGGFPWVIKISNGKVITVSINNSVHNAIRDKNVLTVLTAINSALSGTVARVDIP